MVSNKSTWKTGGGGAGVKVVEKGVFEGGVNRGRGVSRGKGVGTFLIQESGGIGAF